ncbi:GMC oxidoreductase [Mycolicibacter arupensis]|jgi:cholesterol oxidase|uniref:Cholesterol oxidase n=1 Tax=Mycolicibacter arupensis TaxID=342002 RepID=A0A0F5MWB4_9MYCO|nr:GMC family oxidoreductase [Mycolicibacter arupensis]KKB99055.1 cholesterol oxidase [Mycolicibacter arupensis]MCV7275580.1 GMC family oxidoreductase [Mycolicibacter arupensis]OQZ94938.1 cholesterol oxidase [Mycolicibacter arupensis]
MTQDYDVVVIGSGFGGSVSALRLTEKGYRVGVMDMGRRWQPTDFPPNNWHVRKAMWAPKLGCFGPQRLTVLGKTFIASAVGVGGGSLIYGNTLYEPLDRFFDDPQWAHITDWRDELAPYYDQARRMLGVTPTPHTTPADEVLRAVARDLGVEDTYHPTNVGVFFGDEPGKTVADPFFGGAGPRRTGCIGCAQCFTGCPHGAKNTTETNYLYLAERAGAQIHPMTMVTDVRPNGDGYVVSTVRTGRWVRKRRQDFTAGQVVFAAASLGTQRLLHKLRDTGSLPHLSDRLGELTRTNSEEVPVVFAPDRDDFAQGVAITSSIHPEANTHIEVCRYGKGSNLLSMMGTHLIDGGPWRFARLMLTIARHPAMMLRSMFPRNASAHSIIVLVMQSLDNSLTTYRKRGLFGTRMTAKQGVGEPNPDWIPTAHDVARRMADKVGGIAGGTYLDALNIPLTAHFIGGCPIGDSAQSGVIDPYQRAYGHPGLHVVDGSAITANLGVNPSFTITAQAERAMALWPNNGEPDSRPPLGEPYRRIAPVRPLHPAVPESAPGALRLPLSPG